MLDLYLQILFNSVNFSLARPKSIYDIDVLHHLLHTLYQTLEDAASALLASAALPEALPEGCLTADNVIPS